MFVSPPSPVAPNKSDNFCPSTRICLADLGVCLLLGIVASVWAAYIHGWGRLELPVSHTRGSDWDVQLTLLEAIARSYLAGELPQWNPWTAGGVPLLANPEAPVFHPMAFAAIHAHPAAVARVVLFSHVGLQVAGSALLAAVLGARRRWLPIVAVGLLTCDVLVWRMAHGHLMMAQAAWIPWATAALLGLRSPLRAASVAAVVLSIAAHGGGHYPAWMGLYTNVLLTAILAMWAIAHRDRRQMWDAIQRGVGLAVLTALLVAPRWLPTALALADTPRLRGPQAPLAMGDFGIVDALSFVFLSGDWSGIAHAPGLHEGLPSWATPLFFVLPWPLFVVLWRQGRGRSSAKQYKTIADPRVFAVVVTMGIAVLASLGHNLWVNVFGILHFVSPLNRFRNPERWALVWVPLWTALAPLGVQSMWGIVRRPFVRGVAGLVLVSALFVHIRLAIPETQRHTRIDQTTPDSYARLPLGVPVAILEPTLTNFESAGQNIDCLSCSDALLHEAPAAMGEGPQSIPTPAVFDAWSIHSLSFTVPLLSDDAAARLRSTTVVLPQSYHLGWEAKDDAGMPLALGPHPEGVTVTVPVPGRKVYLRFVAPGVVEGLSLGVLGVVFTLVAMLWGARNPSDMPTAQA